MNASVQSSALNQIPLVANTQVLTTSAQAPINSVMASTPVVTASTPIVATQPLMTSVPVAQPVMTSIAPNPQIATSNLINTAPMMSSNPIPEEDYRLGRGILDDFRPTPYNSKILINSAV